MSESNIQVKFVPPAMTAERLAELRCYATRPDGAIEYGNPGFAACTPRSLLSRATVTAPYLQDVLRESLDEIDRLRAEQDERHGEPVAYVAISPDTHRVYFLVGRKPDDAQHIGTGIEWTRSGNHQDGDSILWLERGESFPGINPDECRPLYLGEPIVHKPPPTHVYRDDVLSVFQANGRTAVVCLPNYSSANWHWSVVPSQGYLECQSRERAEQAAAEWVAGGNT